MKVKEKAAYFFNLWLHVNAGGWGNASLSSALSLLSLRWLSSRHYQRFPVNALVICSASGRNFDWRDTLLR